MAKIATRWVLSGKITGVGFTPDGSHNHANGEITSIAWGDTVGKYHVGTISSTARRDSSRSTKAGPLHLKIATSHGYVRIFSKSGIQRALFSVGSMIAAAGKDALVLFVYHQGESFQGSQNLGYSIYKMESG
ncbi:MAG: hypothetical protein J3Q66DRAFT_400039 [Benniella sp.]|nr:MAG: hypothetical protein J3Q66DRAFT_400039 [Benniella sp.]